MGATVGDGGEGIVPLEVREEEWEVLGIRRRFYPKNEALKNLPEFGSRTTTLESPEPRRRSKEIL